MSDSNYTLLPTTTLESNLVEKTSANHLAKSGVLIAALIITLWAISLIGLLTISVNQLSIWLILLPMLWQMFLYTGLFITAHDAMHGSVAPKNPKLNTSIGQLVALVYGLFSYKNLLQKHWLHHYHPASELDPDFHDGIHSHPIAWYFHFMSQYWEWRQLVGFTLLYHFAHAVLQISEKNLILFWIVPSLLSSIQLFYFGTFLTHKQPKGGYKNPHRAKTNVLPVFWSFITCYHFGYHEEHHENPQVPWWQLPSIYRSRTESGLM